MQISLSRPGCLISGPEDPTQDFRSPLAPLFAAGQVFSILWADRKGTVTMADHQMGTWNSCVLDLLHSLLSDANFNSLLYKDRLNTTTNWTDFSYHGTYAKRVVFVSFKMVVGSDSEVGIYFTFHALPSPHLPLRSAPSSAQWRIKHLAW